MPTAARRYLDIADESKRMAHERAGQESYYLAVAQVSAIQAVAAAIERLAQAVENLAGQA
jgi:hypothetical protein